MTKVAGLMLVSVGFILGALVAVLDTVQIKWGYFTGATALQVIGIMIIRSSDRRHKHATHVVSANLETLETSINRIVTHIQDLNQQKTDLDVYSVHNQIDTLFQNDLRLFVEARESMAYVFGLQAYADVMSSFAAAERYLNRVWSASADGYIDEVHTYLDRAYEQFHDSQVKIQQLQSR